MPAVIEKGTKWPTGPNHVEVASDGEQNDEDNDWLNIFHLIAGFLDHFLICGAMGHQTPKGILSGPSTL
jgi:hypothetical protein